MKKLKYPLIVEGKYDKSTLCSLVEGDIIVTNGFGIFRDKQKLALIRQLGAMGPIAILTDSDRAGFLIRGHLTGVVPPEHMIQLYTPEIRGKERRKAAPSAEGKLGVEGMPAEILLSALESAGLLEDGALQSPTSPITKADLFRLGLSGGEGSAQKRRLLLQSLNLPTGISANALPGILSRLMTPEELTSRLSQPPFIKPQP